jgi:hypothetical protein
MSGGLVSGRGTQRRPLAVQRIRRTFFPASSRGPVEPAPGAGRARHSRLALVDGSVAVVFTPAGHLQVVPAFAVGPTGKITGIDVIADPARLRRLRVALLPD